MKKDSLRNLVVGCFWTCALSATVIKPIFVWSGAGDNLHTFGAAIGAIAAYTAGLLACLCGLIAFTAGMRFAAKYQTVLWQSLAGGSVTLIIVEILSRNNWFNN